MNFVDSRIFKEWTRNLIIVFDMQIIDQSAERLGAIKFKSIVLRFLMKLGETRSNSDSVR